MIEKKVITLYMSIKYQGYNKIRTKIAKKNVQSHFTLMLK